MLRSSLKHLPLLLESGVYLRYIQELLDIKALKRQRFILMLSWKI